VQVPGTAAERQDHVFRGEPEAAFGREARRYHGPDTARRPEKDQRPDADDPAGLSAETCRGGAQAGRKGRAAGGTAAEEPGAGRFALSQGCRSRKMGSVPRAATYSEDSLFRMWTACLHADSYL